MRKSIFIDKNKLGEMKYKGSPLRQILALPISAEHQTLLLNFFSHSDVWKLSLNSIANHSFGIKKNRDRVKKSLEQLEAIGLINISENIYAPNLDNIQKQYLTILEAKKVLKTDTQSINNITDTQSITLPDTQSINNINEVIKEEKIKEDKIKMKQAKENIFEDDNFEEIEITKPDLVDLNKSVKEESLTNNISINDFDLVYNSIEYFQRIVINANWNKETLKNHSNSFIASSIFNYNILNEKEKEEMIKKDKTISLQHYLTKYACRIADSELRKHYQHECTVNDRLDLMYH